MPQVTSGERSTRPSAAAPAPLSPPVFLIGGATATGKTALAEALARRFGLPLVGADTMQMYAGLPIASAAPRTDAGDVPCALVGWLPPEETFSAGAFVARALPLAAAAAAAGTPAIICGGTGLYLRALRDGLLAERAADDVVRARLEADLARDGVDALHERLRAVDPEAAAAIPRGNRQRIIRALEVFACSGRPISALWREHAARAAPPPVKTLAFLVVARARGELHERIAARRATMVADGLMEEVARFAATCRARGLDPAATPAARTLGLAELLAALELHPEAAGARGPVEALPPAVRAALDTMALRTRQYAKRQDTWFRKDATAGGATWLDASAAPWEEIVARAADVVGGALEAWRRRGGENDASAARRHGDPNRAGE